MVQEGSGDVIPVYQAGLKSKEVEALRISNGSGHSHRPCSRAIKTGQPVIVKDIAAGKHFRRWREWSLGHGFKSAIALPLHWEDKTTAILSIYSGHTDTFDRAELNLLKELANDISLGLGKIRHAAERQNLTAQLLQA